MLAEGLTSHSRWLLMVGGGKSVGKEREPDRNRRGREPEEGTPEERERELRILAITVVVVLSVGLIAWILPSPLKDRIQEGMVEVMPGGVPDVTEEEE